MTPAADDDGATPFGLLTRLFLRRLIENDLISPHADRHEAVAVLFAATASIAVFATFLLSMRYLATFILLPGPAALSALSDRFLFIAASMILGALGALIVWDALALETRDATILGPLPIEVRTIAVAKLAAAIAFGAALTVALNAASSVLYPTFLTKNIPGISGVAVLRLIAVHGATAVLAGLFGFFGIVAIRGMVRVLFSSRAFLRASSAVQSALVVCMITALLLATGVQSKQVHDWVTEVTVPSWPVQSVLWYLGLNEAEAGHLVAEAPLVLPFRIRSVPLRVRREDQDARAVYGTMRQPFEALARRARLSWALVTILALATFFWTNRRLPDRSAHATAASRIRTSIRRFADWGTQGDAEAQAGFFFTFQALARSGPHRTILAISVALGLTHALVVMAHSGVQPVNIESPLLGVFGISTMLVLSLLCGLRYAVAVPAELNANWTIRMAWLGDERAYLIGVKRVGLLLVCSFLLLLFPLHIALLGTTRAIVHSLLNVVLAIAAIHVLFLPYRKLPFACGYVPFENPKVVWPAGLVGLVLVTYGWAALERRALQTGTRTLALGLTIAAIVFVLRTIDAARRQDRAFVDFDGRPTPATQRLGLFEHIGGQS
jgi:hypothetical protein